MLLKDLTIGCKVQSLKSHYPYDSYPNRWISCKKKGEPDGLFGTVQDSIFPLLWLRKCLSY